MNKGRVQDIEQPCNTISSHLAKVSLNGTDPVLMVGERYRRFSPREAANIQSFPLNFQFDCVSDNRQYRAIGNAVPPVLMWHVANAVAGVPKTATRKTVKFHRIIPLRRSLAQATVNARAKMC
ncbi:DNA cytosine methyltransferase [Kingella kingae]|nr:DNA cytosine methyltransferase [Kingella kingae]MDK4534143.1 DNA cytosine methyltransferase [Kingella kingae]MDK4541807.1 DNA cytosine methyltransferase [Kingella kingae]UOP02341.1 DNA cytosine methyltransferase [Kingella kingae]